MPSRPSSRRGQPRGAVLLEAMAASAVFAIGIAGLYQGIIFASRQNAVANRMVRAGAIASQLRSALEAQGFAHLSGAGGALEDAQCTAVSDVTERAAGLDGVTGACVIDLDAYEAGAAAGLRLQPGYSDDDRRIYRRVLVRMPVTADSVLVGVVVSWKEMGEIRFHKHFAMVLRPTPRNGKITF